ncbi:hypothetical protein DXG03_002920 [Asterophora parasitica]|uniref:Hydrophobic surface binding protein n=1 Tax=Asterophora parasitica TaxID=117018 RepID=A0A9P7KC99_9AGAR|nr:hypothetical protein DXG03_002920 [Asterophora parasitica]
MKLLSAILLLLTVIVSSVYASVSDVKADLSKVAALVTKLDKTITNFPADGGTISDGIAINNDVTALGQGLDKATQNVKAIPPFSNSDSITTVGSAKVFSPTIVHLLNGVVEKKSSIGKINFPGIFDLVRGALQDLGTKGNALGNALAESSTGPAKSQAQAIQAELRVAFEKAVKAYS